MNILLTCDRYPWPPQDGLVLRIVNYVRILSARHSFDLVCLDRRPGVTSPQFDRFFRRIYRIPYMDSRKRSIWQRLRTAFDVEDLYPRSQAATSTINRLIASNSYDLIWDAGSNMMNCLNDARRRIPLLADQVDDSFVRLRRELSVAKGVYSSVWLRKQMLLQTAFAQRFLEPADAVLFVSPSDAESFHGVCPTARAYTLANGVDTKYFAPMACHPAASEPTPELVFEGAMDFGPNVDAVQYFACEIFGLIRAHCPRVHWSIVGRDPAPSVAQLACDFITVTGFVDDIREWLQHADVFVCPMRSGAGIKNKILQAWAMGLAVVSTPEGAMGLAAQDGENIVICSTPRQFADAVIRLLGDRSERARLGANGRRTVVEKYSWERQAYALEEILMHVSEAGGARVRGSSIGAMSPS